MKNVLNFVLFLSIAAIICSCSTQKVFLCENAGHVRVYDSKSQKSGYTIIPSEKNLLAVGKDKKKYRKVTYSNIEGYVYRTKFRTERELSENQLYNLYFDTNQGKYIIKNDISRKVTSMTPSVGNTVNKQISSTSSVRSLPQDGTNARPAVSPLKDGTKIIYDNPMTHDNIKVKTVNGQSTFIYSVTAAALWTGKMKTTTVYTGDYSSFSSFINKLFQFAEKNKDNVGATTVIDGVNVESTKKSGVKCISIGSGKDVINTTYNSINMAVDALTKWANKNNFSSSGKVTSQSTSTVNRGYYNSNYQPKPEPKKKASNFNSEDRLVYIGADIGFTTNSFLTIGASCMVKSWYIGVSFNMDVNNGMEGKSYKGLNKFEEDEVRSSGSGYFESYQFDLGYYVIPRLCIGAGIGYAPYTIYENRYDKSQILASDGLYNLYEVDGGKADIKGFATFHVSNYIYFKAQYSNITGGGASIGFRF